jgi:ubiquinone/menaquinone biosynthesis C-methylase UbiE
MRTEMFIQCEKKLNEFNIDQMTTDNFRKHTTNNPLQKFLINRFFTLLIKELKYINPDTILDVGCGEGFTLEKIRKNNIGKDLEGIDFGQQAVDLGKKTYPHLKLKQGDIYQLPYENNSFDLVLCSEVLEHLEYPEKAMKEIYRVTKKYCVITVPNEPFFRLANLLRGKNISRWGNDIEHIQHWSVRGIMSFVRGYFKVKAVRTSFPWTIVVSGK